VIFLNKSKTFDGAMVQKQIDLKVLFKSSKLKLNFLKMGVSQLAKIQEQVPSE